METATLLKDRLHEEGTVFVFPSELTARFWLKESFRYTSRRALPADRFLSWDGFKEALLDFPGDRRPVTRALRTLYTSRLLERNREERFFKKLINPAFAENSPAFLKAIRRILPSLHHLERLGPSWPRISPEKQADLHLLWKDYTRFLAEKALFEPNYEKPRLRRDGKRYFIFFPQIIEDYSNFASLIAECPHIHLAPSPRPHNGGKEPRITSFDDSLQELKWVLLRLGELLDRGVDPERIALSVAELPTIEPSLKRFSELYEVPLRIHSGGPVSLYPEARFFSRIAECIETGFSLEAMKDLLLSAALPWRHSNGARKLIRFGLDRGILGNFRDGGVPDRWLRELDRVAGGNAALREARNFYRSLKKSLTEIYRASDFDHLKVSLISWANRLLDTSDWPAEQQDIFSFALNTIDELSEAARQAKGLSVGHPFRLWLGYLEDRIYVRRKNQGGIPVYPYRVAAGIAPDYHFIINTSQQGTLRLIRHYPFLAAHEEGELADRELDLTDRFLKLYAASGARTFFSYAKRGFRQTYLPPAFFVIGGSIEPAPAGEGRSDILRDERRFWAGEAFPRCLTRLQKEGFETSLRTILAPGKEDFTSSPVRQRDLAARIAGLLSTEDGFLRITPTALEAFHACPFHFLLERALGLFEEVYRPVLFDARRFGELLHKVLQSFFEEILDEEPVLSASKLARYRKLIEKAVQEVLTVFEQDYPFSLPPLREEIAGRAVRLVGDCIETEMEEMADERIVSVEARLEHRRPRDKLLLLGKIDRLSQPDGGEDGYTLIDYKKKRLPSRREIFGPDAVSFQMPFYVLLASATGIRVKRAAYYSLEDRLFKLVLDPEKRSMADPERMAACLDALEDRIKITAESIREGRYPIPSPRDRSSCLPCPFKGVCRSGYNL